VENISDYSQLFIWYCCVVGIIGNVYICKKLAFKISGLKKIKKLRTGKMRDLENILTFSVEDRKSIFDRENNMSLFHYFIGSKY